MNAEFLNEMENHLQAINSEIETLISRNESMMMQCQNFDKSLPYLKQYYDLSSMKALNSGYLEDMNFGKSFQTKTLNLQRLG